VAEITQPRPLFSVRQLRRDLQDGERLLATLSRLQASGEIDAARAERLRGMLGTGATKVNYILRHLAAHLAIGAGRWTVPILPVGSFLRCSWVVLSRTTERLRRRPDHASVHSLEIFLISCLPFAGYLAYIVALRRHDPDIALLYANHISILRYDRHLEDVLRDKPAAIGRVVRRAVGTGTGRGK
jgi:hypothetical protein